MSTIQCVIPCPTHPAYRLVLSADEVFTDDPGNGTPLMVYGPGDASGTFNAAADTGELSCGSKVHPLPAAVRRWLDSDAIDVVIADFFAEVSA